MSTINKEQNRMTRRDFVKKAAAGTAAVIGAGMLATPAQVQAQSPQPWLPAKWDYEADVVVVGFGLAGINAALVADDARANVILLEKAPEKFAGGNSTVSGGASVLHTAAGISDAKLYYRALGSIPDELADAMAEELVDDKFKAWYDKLGIGYYVGNGNVATFKTLPGSSAINVTLTVTDKPDGFSNGRKNWLAFKGVLAKRSGIKVMYETPAKHLIQDPITKGILGVVAEQMGKQIYIKAKRGVVLACGGFEFNYEMQDYFNYPGIKIYSRGSPYNTGDGLNMASEIGAPLWHMTGVEFHKLALKTASDSFGLAVSSNMPTNNYVLVN